MRQVTMFVLGASDLTEKVNMRKFKVNAEDEIRTWVDANHVTHGDFIRSKIKGSLQLLFLSATEYNQFVTLVNDTRGNDGKYQVEVYVDSRGESVEINAFLEFTTNTVFANDAYNGVPMVFQVDVKLEEE